MSLGGVSEITAVGARTHTLHLPDVLLRAALHRADLIDSKHSLGVGVEEAEALLEDGAEAAVEGERVCGVRHIAVGPHKLHRKMMRGGVEAVVVLGMTIDG